MKYRFSYQFCDLLNINNEYDYTVNTILQLLISNAVVRTKQNYKFNNELYKFLSNILVMPSIGYYRKDLIKIINILSISEKKIVDYIIINNEEKHNNINNFYIEL